MRLFGLMAYAGSGLLFLIFEGWQPTVRHVGRGDDAVRSRRVVRRGNTGQRDALQRLTTSQIQGRRKT